MFSKKSITRCFAILLLLSLIGCSKILTQEKLNQRAGFLPTPRSAKANCEVDFVIKMPEDSTQYELIGTCLSKKRARSYSVKNYAMKGINKCACHNQGNLVRVISAKEYFGVHSLSFNGLPDFLNFPATIDFISKTQPPKAAFRKLKVSCNK